MEKDLIDFIDKYNELIEKEDFEGIDKICGDDGPFDFASTLAESIPNCVVFETKGYNSCGYDLNSYVFAWINKGGKIEGKVLDVESF